LLCVLFPDVEQSPTVRKASRGPTTLGGRFKSQVEVLK
jgi:hypothetical protein